MQLSAQPAPVQQASRLEAIEPRPSLSLVTVTHFFPAHGGGLELVADRLAREFAVRGMEVRWFSSDTDDPPSNAHERITHVPMSSCNVIERVTQLPYPLWSPLSLPALWRAIGSATLVHIHEHLYFSSLVAFLFARARKRPVVVTQHMGALRLGRPSLTRLYEAGARLLGRFVFRRVSRAVFISANVQRFFRCEDDPRARLVFNGLDTDRFRPIADEFRPAVRGKLGLPADRKVILFVGRFVRKKGLHLIEQLARRHPDYLWLMVGSGPENPAGWRLPNVRVDGRIDHDRLPEYYQAADLLLLPSSGEGFPLVVQEALSCGLGVLTTHEVASACPAATRMILACPASRDGSDAGTWDDALQRAIVDAAYLERRIDRSRAAHALWSWKTCASRYVELFEEIAASSGRVATG